MADSGVLPAGMWFYSFMFDNRHLLPGQVEAGLLPAPSSLAVGMAVGAALTAARFVLDFAVFKVRRGALGVPPLVASRESWFVVFQEEPFCLEPAFEEEHASCLSEGD